MALASHIPAMGTSVMTYGFGMFGVGADPAAGCTNGVDGNKRNITWSLSAPPYRTCPGDSGGP